MKDIHREISAGTLGRDHVETKAGTSARIHMISWNGTTREIYGGIENLWRNSWSNLPGNFWYYIKWKFSNRSSVEFLDVSGELPEANPAIKLRKFMEKKWKKFNNWKIAKESARYIFCKNF